MMSNVQGFLPGRHAVLLGAASAAAAFVAMSDAHGMAPDQNGRCKALAGFKIAMRSIGLPTRGAEIASATMMIPDGTGGAPFCKVLGEVLATNPSDPPIRFEVNLPTNWNSKMLQFGGGGFNGTVVTGLDQAPHVSPLRPTPLALGYATFGGDSGHSTPGGSFGQNGQALANYSGESVKRTHDAAMSIVRSYFGRMPRRTYYVGGSKGGHEALVAAQRYPNDYDGVVAYYPANQNQALVLSWYRMWSAAHGTRDAVLTSAEQTFLKNATLKACDGLDGLKDGVVSNVRACQASFDLESLTCSLETSMQETCLKPAQIAVLKVAATPLVFGFTLANGVDRIGPYPVKIGADTAGVIYDKQGMNTYKMFADQVLMYFDSRSDSPPNDNLDYHKYQTRVEALSRIYDATNPDIDAFRKRGGKMLLVQGTVDMLVPEPATTTYFNALKDRYGSTLRNFARYYVQPGFGHGSGDFLMSWDSLSALDDWVERGRPPFDPVAIDEAPATRGRSRPLCENPGYPRYLGTGDQRRASSFRCEATGR